MASYICFNIYKMQIENPPRFIEVEVYPAQANSRD